MLLGRGLIAKGLLGALTLSAGVCGIYYTYNYFQGKMTKFDKALIDYLNGGGKIKFSVKSGNNTIGGSFPSFNNENNKITATIKVKVATDNVNETDDGKLEDKEGAKEGDRAKTDTLRKLLGDNGEDWTWICEINFTRKPEDNKVNEVDEKDLLVKASSGFFNRLNDLGAEHNEMKAKFIKNCANSRKDEKNRDINRGIFEGNTKEIKTEKSFELIKGDANKKDKKKQPQLTTKLYFEREWEFNRWFL